MAMGERMGWDCAWAVGRLAGWHAAMGPRYRRWKRAPPLRLPNLSLPGGPWPLLGWHCGEDDVVLNFTHPSAGEHHDPSPRTTRDRNWTPSPKRPAPPDRHVHRRRGRCSHRRGRWLIGGLVGTAVCAVVGGLAGKGAAAAVNPTDEDAYWRDAHGREPYYSDADTYEDYAPPYRHGYQSVIDGRSDWNEVRSDLQQRWGADRQSSRLNWMDAEPAVKAPWERADRIWKQTKQE
jgi:hypothetical protein